MQPTHRLSAAYSPFMMTEHKAVMQSLLSRFRDEGTKLLASKGYETVPLVTLQSEQQGIQNDQSRWVQHLCSSPVTEQWLRKYNQLFPHVEGIIAIEELYQADVSLAIANILMVEADK